jgi:hypothetical protein
MRALPKYLPSCLLASGLAVATISANAQIVTLINNNATAQVNTASQAGMDFWSVDGNGLSGQNQLQQQWFWYRVGSGVQQSIDTMSAPSITLAGSDNLTTTYFNTNLNFNISVSYGLLGNGIGSSDISEGIQIQNTSSSSRLTISFFQYSHFTLLGQNYGNTITMGNNLAYQYNGETAIQEGIIAPNASAYEANTVGGTNDTLLNLNTTPGFTLNGTNAASGDVTWAFEWDLNIAPGGVFDISKDKILSISSTPEPTVLGLISTGFAVVALRRRFTVKKG